MRLGTGRHRRTRTLSIAAAVAVTACASGVYLGLSNGGAQAASTTVTVSTTAQLESAVKNASAGTVIQVRAGDVHPEGQSQVRGQRHEFGADHAAGVRQ